MPNTAPISPQSARVATLALRLDAALPQTQCTRCGYPDCRAYAQAIAEGDAPINRCPPGGAEGIARLAAIIGQAELPLDPECGAEGPLRRAVIDEAWCIGCTLCIKACPVDCIVGASKWMHTVIEDQCTGCELCIPACPVDCIALVAVDEQRTGWAAWGAVEADAARRRYSARNARREASPKLDAVPAASAAAATDRRRAIVEAARVRAQAQALSKAPQRSTIPAR